MKITKQFAGWYDAKENNEIKYTIVQSENGSWNIFEKDNTVTGMIDATDTLKEAKQYIIAMNDEITR